MKPFRDQYEQKTKKCLCNVSIFNQVLSIAFCNDQLTFVLVHSNKPPALISRKYLNCYLHISITVDATNASEGTILQTYGYRSLLSNSVAVAAGLYIYLFIYSLCRCSHKILTL